jgi:hypothetical protein
MGVASQVIASAGATGARTWTNGLASSPPWFAVSLALAPSSDSTAPTVSSVAGAALTTTTASGSFSTNEGNGTAYYVTTLSATAPTKAQVKSGLDNSGAAASYAGSQAISSTGTKTFTASTLPQGSTLYHHVMHEDAAANQSTVASSSSFKTFGIHDTDTDNAVNESQSSVVINGKFGASQPVVRIKSGTVSQDQTVSAHDASTVTLTSVTRGNLPYTDTNHTHTIEVDTDQS